jgi:hypothetical protein
MGQKLKMQQGNPFKQIVYYENKAHIYILLLKVSKCEIFDCSDFHDFYTIMPFWVGDFGAKI